MYDYSNYDLNLTNKIIYISLALDGALIIAMRSERPNSHTSNVVIRIFTCIIRCEPRSKKSIHLLHLHILSEKIMVISVRVFWLN